MAFHSLAALSASHLEKEAATLEGMDFVISSEMPAEQLADSGGQHAVLAEGTQWLPAESLSSKLLGKASSQEAVTQMQAA